MKYTITAENTTVTPAIAEYIEKRFSKFEKYLPDYSEITVRIQVKDDGKRHKVSVTIFIGKDTIRAEKNSKNMYAAIDDIQKVITRVLRKKKEKHINARNVPIEAITEDDLPHMTEKEALLQFQSCDDEIFAYFDTDSKTIQFISAFDD